jgi:hypothetical protein
MTRTRIYLGTHRPDWLGFSDVPLFVARTYLALRKTFPRARAPWALDSGGFTELNKHGRWTITPADYVAEVRRFRDGVGRLEWAAVQDWMCEDVVLKKTGLTIADHQARTIDSLIELRSRAPEVPWCPVLQGWTLGLYLDHVEEYARRGIDLTREPIVGIGSVCRRQHTLHASMIVRDIVDLGINLHGFGFKVDGLRELAGVLTSSDSLAWSYKGRRSRNEGGMECDKNACNNCYHFAREWLADLRATLPPDAVEVDVPSDVG